MAIIYTENVRKPHIIVNICVNSKQLEKSIYGVWYTETKNLSYKCICGSHCDVDDSLILVHTGWSHVTNWYIINTIY